MKKILRIFKHMLLGLIILFTLLVVLHQTLTLIEKRKYPTIGQMVTVDNHKMSVYIAGEGKNTIVLLPGLGTPAPILDFMPLVDELAKYNRVVVVEPFGYGWSDITSKERTIENEVEEIRSALQEAQIEGPYIFMPHSRSGLHTIYYANTYPEEVAGVITIDCSMPIMTEYFNEEVPDPLPLITGQLVNLGTMRLFSLIAPKEYVSCNDNLYYTDENLAMQNRIVSWNAYNKNIVDQLNHLNDSLAKTHDMTYREDLPILFITTDNSDLPPRTDGKTSVSLYDAYIKNPSLQKVIPLTGPHYLHWTCKNEILDAVKEFMTQYY